MCIRDRKLLVVEDDRLVSLMLTDSLEHAGYLVTCARSAEEAEELLVGGLRADLAILDIRLPGQGGLYLAHRLQDWDRIPFIVLSAYGDDSTVNEALALGAFAFYSKPIEQAQLQLAVSSALARSQELQAVRTKEKSLQQALDNERSINVAVGITMAHYRLSRVAAFDQLRAAARARNVRLAEFATTIVNSCELMSTNPDKPS